MAQPILTEFKNQDRSLHHSSNFDKISPVLPIKETTTKQLPKDDM